MYIFTLELTLVIIEQSDLSQLLRHGKPAETAQARFSRRYERGTMADGTNVQNDGDVRENS